MPHGTESAPEPSYHTALQRTANGKRGYYPSGPTTTAVINAGLQLTCMHFYQQISARNDSNDHFPTPPEPYHKDHLGCHSCCVTDNPFPGSKVITPSYTRVRTHAPDDHEPRNNATLSTKKTQLSTRPTLPCPPDTHRPPIASWPIPLAAPLL